MLVPEFVLRRLYRRGSLRETGDGRFAFTLQNPLASTTLLAPPSIVVNGIAYAPDAIQSRRVDLAGISKTNPFRFAKGDKVTLRFPGRLLRGGNRIHVVALTKEFGDVDFVVEDKEAIFCDIPSAGGLATDSEE